MPPATLDTLLSYETLIALGVTTAFAGGAWLLRGVTIGGAFTGFAVAFVVFVTMGPGAFAVLITVFAIAWLSTRLGYGRKRALGMAQDARGRSAAQVLANLGAAAVLGAASNASGHHILVVAAMAAFAEAAADTAASECGEALSDHAYLVTSLRRVKAGTDGGVSPAGTAAAILAAVVVGLVAAANHVVAWTALPVVAGAGVLGSLVDSLLGATLERRSIIGNNGVNFASTLAAGLMALLLGR